MKTSFYSDEELNKLGLKSYGQDVFISRYAKIYCPEKIELGSHVRIDDFCILSGKITIGSYVHISAASLLFAGNSEIVFEDYSGLSSRSAVYAESDDYSGNFMTNPMIPNEYRNVISEKVIFRKYSMVGSGCTVLPGVIIGEGVSVGCMSMINRDLEEWGIYAGIPCHRIKDRERTILELARKLETEYK